MMRRAFALLLCMCGIGPVGAGSGTVEPLAWVAEYRVHDDRGDRVLRLVRTDDRVEYRWAGEPVRFWRSGADGLEHREIFVSDGRVVSFTPGDLRALGRNPGWPQLNHLVEPSLRTQLTAHGTTKPVAVGNDHAQRYRGEVGGVPVQLDWIEAAGLPARYRSGKGRSVYLVELRALEQRPADQAFTATEGLREIDYADIGDMELDLFASRYIRQGATAEH